MWREDFKWGLVTVREREPWVRSRPRPTRVFLALPSSCLRIIPVERKGGREGGREREGEKEERGGGGREGGRERGRERERER